MFAAGETMAGNILDDGVSRGSRPDDRVGLRTDRGTRGGGSCLTATSVSRPNVSSRFAMRAGTAKGSARSSRLWSFVRHSSIAMWAIWRTSVTTAAPAQTRAPSARPSAGGGSPDASVDGSRRDIRRTRTAPFPLELARSTESAPVHRPERDDTRGAPRGLVRRSVTACPRRTRRGAPSTGSWRTSGS